MSNKDEKWCYSNINMWCAYRKTWFQLRKSKFSCRLSASFPLEPILGDACWWMCVLSSYDQSAICNFQYMPILKFEYILSGYLKPCAIKLCQSALHMGCFAMILIRCLVRLGLTCSSHPWFQSLPQASHLLANTCPQWFFERNTSLHIRHVYRGTTTSTDKMIWHIVPFSKLIQFWVAIQSFPLIFKYNTPGETIV